MCKRLWTLLMAPLRGLLFLLYLPLMGIVLFVGVLFTRIGERLISFVDWSADIS